MYSLLLLICNGVHRWNLILISICELFFKTHDPDWPAKFWWNNHHREMSHSTLGRVKRAKLKAQKKMEGNRLSTSPEEPERESWLQVFSCAHSFQRNTDKRTFLADEAVNSRLRASGGSNGPELPEYTPRDQRLLVGDFLKDKQQKYIYRMKSGVIFSILFRSAVINRNELIMVQFYSNLVYGSSQEAPNNRLDEMNSWGFCGGKGGTFIITLTWVKPEQKGYCSLSLNSISFPLTPAPPAPSFHSSLPYKLRLVNKMLGFYFLSQQICPNN